MRIITGTGRCGTTFIAMLLYHCGYDQNPATEPREIVTLNAEIIREVRERGLFFPDETLAKELSEKHKAEIENLPWNFPKDPRFTVTLPVLYYAGVVEFVLLCIRDLYQSARSCVATGGMGAIFGLPIQDYLNRVIFDMGCRLGYLVTFLEWKRIPYSFVKYPDMVRDYTEVIRALPELETKIGIEKFKQIHDKVANEEKIHFE